MHKSVALFLALSAPVAFGLTEQRVNENFDVPAGGKLIVDVDFGTVDVSGTSGGKVVVDAYRKIDASDEQREKEYFEDAPIVVTRDGNTVTVRARSKRERNQSWSGRINVDGRYNVQLPRQFNVDLRTSGGSISVNDIKGAIKTNTSGGKLKFTQIEGPIDGRTSGGSIEMESCVGDSNVNTSGGSITVKGGRGRLDARTSGGSIAVRQYTGDTDVKTNGGALTLENISGKITGRTSAGSIDVSLADPVSADVNLDSSAGSIDLAVPPKAGLDVDAKTSIGKIRTEIPMLAMKSGDDRLQGTLNGGGKSVVLRASVGSITIKPTAPATAAR